MYADVDLSAVDKAARVAVLEDGVEQVDGSKDVEVVPPTPNLGTGR